MAEHNLTPEKERYVESHAPYFKVFWTLLILTGLEYGFARLQLPFVINATGLGAMAALYGFLVAWYFMHLKFEGRWIYLMIAPVCVLTVVVLAGLTPDIVFHQSGFYQATAVADH
jgi:cytochrome c oxidase subunit 4